MNKKIYALKAAFPHTIPILAGFTFLGVAYGIYMRSLGLSPIYPILMCLLIFAGSLEFLAGNLLLGSFDPLSAFMLGFVVNARHIFYGLSMLDKYKDCGKKKAYLIYGLCDETFSLNLTVDPPKGVDRTDFMFFITLLDQVYWVLGTVIGSFIGNIIPFDTTGLDFILTALFIVIFLDYFMKEKPIFSSLVGFISSIAALVLFSSSSFIIPSMVTILLVLLIKGKIDECS